MFAFSTCWNSHRHTDGRAMLNEVRALGFEYAELGHGTRLSLMEGIQQAVAAGEIAISSLHNFCPLPLGVMTPAPDYYLPSSRKPTERQLAARYTLQTIDWAARLGAKVVVLHLGLVPMRNYTAKLLQMWQQGQAETPRFQRLRDKAVAVRERKRPKHLECVFRTLETVVPRAREQGVKLAMETRLGIEEIPSEEEASEITARFGADAIAYWYDVGHGLVKENLGLMNCERVLERFRGRTAGMHLQDFTPPASDHQPPGVGTFDFGRLQPFISDDMILTWEIHPDWTMDQLSGSFQRAHESLRKRSPV